MNDNEKKEIFIKIGKRIQYFRTQAHLTQEQLAEKIGISAKHLSRIEAGRHNPYFDTIIMITKELDIQIDALLEDVDDNYINTFLQLIKSDVTGMSMNQLKMLRKCIALIKEFNF